MSREISYSSVCSELEDLEMDSKPWDGWYFLFSSPQTILCSSFSSPCLVRHTQTHKRKAELASGHLFLATGEFKWKVPIILPGPILPFKFSLISVCCFSAHKGNKCKYQNICKTCSVTVSLMTECNDSHSRVEQAKVTSSWFLWGNS